MNDPYRYVERPFAFMFRYVSLRPKAHAIIVAAVLAAVTCSVVTQYGVKYLVDVLSGTSPAHHVWYAFFFLVSLIAADNLLWRLAGWLASFTFVRVTGDVRRDLFRHLTGHSPSYFVSRLPGTLTSRITATSNAVFTTENMFVWNVLPPCVASIAAILLVLTISVSMAAVLTVIAGAMVLVMFRMAAQGGRCITTSLARPPPSTARWSMSSPTCRWSRRFAASAANIAGSMRSSIAR